MSEPRLCFLKTYLRQVVTSKLYKWKIIYFGKMPLITFITNEILDLTIVIVIEMKEDINISENC